MLVVSDVLRQHFYLSAPDACADVTQSVVVADVFGGRGGLGFSGLRGNDERARGGFGCGTNDGATSSRGNHLITIKA